MPGSVLEEAVAGFAAAVDALLSLPVETMPAPEIMPALAAVERQRNRLACLDQRLIAGLAASGAVLESGSTSLPGLVSSLTRCSRGAARARVGRSVDLGPRRTVGGAALEPIHPVTAEAITVGAVSEEQSRVIVAVLARIGPDAEPDAFEIAERFLVEAARVQPPEALRVCGEWILDRVDPSGRRPTEDAVERARDFSLIDTSDAAGGVMAKGRLTAELDAVLRAIFDVLAAPRPANEQGERDARTAGQRRHDALLEMALRLLRSGELPDCGGVPASVIVQLRGHGLGPTAETNTDETNTDETSADETSADETNTDETSADETSADETSADETSADETSADETSADETSASEWTHESEFSEAGAHDPGEPAAVRPVDGSLITRLSGIGWFGTGAPATLNRLRPLFAECEITTVVLSATGGVLDYGRDRRVATPAMRRALTARDSGCCFPGCERPPAWCEAHHVWAWIDGGPTCIDNLCLLCSYHHRSFGPAGWQVVMRDEVPVWIPPAWLDPCQAPVRNTARHLTELDFGARTAVPMRT